MPGVETGRLLSHYSLPGLYGILAPPQESFPTAMARTHGPALTTGGRRRPGDARLRGAEARLRAAAHASSGLLKLSLRAEGCHRPLTRFVGRATSRVRGWTAPRAWSNPRRRTGPPPSRQGPSTPD